MECERIGITALVKVVPEDRCAGHRFSSHPESRENSSAAGQSVVQLKNGGGSWVRVPSTWGDQAAGVASYHTTPVLGILMTGSCYKAIFFNYMSKEAQNN